MGTRWRPLYSGRGRARHHSGISVCENRAGTERAKKARDPRRDFLNGCSIETEAARCIVCGTIYLFSPVRNRDIRSDTQLLLTGLSTHDRVVSVKSALVRVSSARPL